VQFSRGCPFNCEFCDIIELYGRVPRAKTNEQMLEELDALYALGYRGHVDFVDDNLIGNKRRVKEFLPHLKTWLEAHDYPFEFTTEATINLADDPELLTLMKETGFFAIFVGIESPDTDTLLHMQKPQNTRRVLQQSVEKIYRAGIFVHAGPTVPTVRQQPQSVNEHHWWLAGRVGPGDLFVGGRELGLRHTATIGRVHRYSREIKGSRAISASRAGTQCDPYRSRRSDRRQSSPLITPRHSVEPQAQSSTKSDEAVLVA